MSPMFHRGLGWLVLAMALAAATSADADSATDKAAIRERLQHWTAAFNARDAAGTCDLFAPDLVYSVPQMIHGTRESMCTNLTKLFDTPRLQLHYDTPAIHEIIISGDVAIVRLTWTLTTQTGAGRDVTKEEGRDIFRRQLDGRWSIARFIAFGTQPNKNLQ